MSIEKASLPHFVVHMGITFAVFVIALNPFYSAIDVLADPWPWSTTKITLVVLTWFIIGLFIGHKVRHVWRDDRTWAGRVGVIAITVLSGLAFTGALSLATVWHSMGTVTVVSLAFGVWSYGPHLGALYRHLDGKWRGQRTRQLNHSDADNRRRT